jgi:hypothetical protein
VAAAGSGALGSGTVTEGARLAISLAYARGSMTGSVSGIWKIFSRYSIGIVRR